jgi:AcrR family transcriptional regulator
MPSKRASKGQGTVQTKETSRGAKRQPIIEAAVQVFAEKGYAGAVVADIARRANIGKGTIYEYFASKEDLFFAVFQWYLERTNEAVSGSLAPPEPSAARRLEALSRAVMALWVEIKDTYALVMEFWAASSSAAQRERFKEAFREAYRQFRQRLTALIGEGIASGEFDPGVDPEAVAASMVGAWDALLLQAWFEEAFDPQETAATFLQVVLKGMQPRQQRT